MGHLALIIAFILLTACGQKGPLYLPEKREASVTQYDVEDVPMVTGHKKQEK